MNLLLKIVNNPKENIAALSHEFKKENGSIGRGSECSWVLADKAQEVSSLHLEVEYRTGVYYMIDLSTNGTLYKNENKRVAPQELVSFEEGDVLSIGPYDVLVGFVKSQSKNNVIDNFLNKREIDIAMEEKVLTKKTRKSPLDLILKVKVKDKNILELANIKPKETLFEDAFEEISVADAYTSHINPPSFEAISKAEEANSVKPTFSLLENIFASKLGINLESMNQAEQIETVSELAQSILVALEGIEALEHNASKISQKLQKPNLKVEAHKPKGAKNLLQAQLHPANVLSFSQSLSKKFNSLAEKHSALYEASKALSEELEHEFAPNTLAQEFKVSGLFGQDAKNWRAYLSKYSYLNEITASKGFQHRLFKKYESIMEMFKLSQGSK